ncbi:adenosylhomocysteinase [Paenibacillus ehimensis]|uniref:adenosylhomocysteinase n=1 Tax=Paenibacillus ehimensis TaxID=79264 RepID=UPI002DBA5125|nr:adenosylhomocysteinase [Paenibacillus ehimensis]MEC0210315.1 adenosylhomocysteinase [Paenibacillus ehimensis]
MQAIVRTWINDSALAQEGRRRISRASSQMPVMNRLRERFALERPFKGLKIVLALPPEASTACLGKALQAGGAELVLAGGGPHPNNSGICAALAADGITVITDFGTEPETVKGRLIRAMETGPHLIVDDSGELVAMLQAERPDLLAGIRGGAARTRAGLPPLMKLEKEQRLPFPMIVIDDAPGMDALAPRFGTVPSVWDDLLQAAAFDAAGKTVVVAGYGLRGKAIAMQARALGAHVVVAELDPPKAVEAFMDGCQVMRLQEAALIGDLLISATGAPDTIGGKHCFLMKDGVLLCQTGLPGGEINTNELADIAVSRGTVRKNLERYELIDGRKIYLYDARPPANETSVDDDCAETTDMRLALLALSLHYMNGHYDRLGNEVMKAPYALDEEIAVLKLQSLGLNIDEAADRWTG